MEQLNNIKIRVKSAKEAETTLQCLFKNGHAWRGGSTRTALSSWEVENIVGICVADTDPDDCYRQTAAVTFMTDVVGFWKDCLVVMPSDLILEHYRSYEGTL